MLEWQIMKSCLIENGEIMPVKPNKQGQYPVQILLSRKEYDLLRKEAYKLDKTINKYIKEAVLDFVQRK